MTSQTQAGGGNPSTLSTLQDILSLSPDVLAHLKAIFTDISYGDAQGLTAHDRDVFLTEIQGEADAAEQSESLLYRNDQLDLSDFLGYATSPEFNALAYTGRQKLDYPLSSYFISSSHNTYLSGNQLYSHSSTEEYRNVLLRGCRCVEIDVWDGDPRPPTGDKEDGKAREKKQGLRSKLETFAKKKFGSEGKAEDESSKVEIPTTAVGDLSLSKPAPWISMSVTTRAEPRVLHGHTLTREVSFREVCIAIRETAFVSSDLPVIVSLEVHACVEQQEVMIDIMKEVWDDYLLDRPCGEALSEEDVKTLPSPGELLRKILVKVKYVPPQQSIVDKAELPERNISRDSSGSEDEANAGKGQREKKSKLSDALSRLAVYTRGYHFKHLSQPEASIPTHVFSVSEGALRDLRETHASALFEHNKRFLMRAFPAGFRFDSSNLDPSVFWRQGVQMVALNWQKYDEGMMLNEGMFASSGGWILKPEGYRDVARSASPEQSDSPQADIVHKKLDLTIELLAAQDLPLPLGNEDIDGFHPYVKCELHVEKPSERANKPIEGSGRAEEGEYKRRSKTYHGVSPDFGKESLSFEGVEKVVEELSFLRLKVQDNRIGRDSLAGWSCIRLDRLQRGFRFIHLFDAKGSETKGLILVRIYKTLH